MWGVWVLNWMIGFIGTSLRLQSITTAPNLWLLKTRSIPYWTTSVFSSTVTDFFWFTNQSLLLRLPWTTSVWRILQYSESESDLLYDWMFTANQFVLATSPLRPTTGIFIFQVNTCGCSPYVTSSLTRGWVCRLQLLLILASAFILRSESRRTHDHILLSQIRDSTNLEGQVPVFISPRSRVAWLYPQALCN
jgi:hypothetical protein